MRLHLRWNGRGDANAVAASKALSKGGSNREWHVNLAPKDALTCERVASETRESEDDDHDGGHGDELVRFKLPFSLDHHLHTLLFYPPNSTSESQV